MKFTVVSVVIVGAAQAFAPAQFGVRAVTARSFGVDHSVFQDLPHQVHTLQHAFSTLNLADALDAVADTPTPDAVVDAAAAGSGNGWFGFLEAPIEGLLKLCHSALVTMGMTENSWGLSILFMTTLIKLLTFPLTKTQLESTNKMQVSPKRTETTETIFDMLFETPSDLFSSTKQRPFNQNSRKCKTNTKVTLTL
jgi:membrane protein insertase Oxa1/YidC/SpoIIIJ